MDEKEIQRKSRHSTRTIGTVNESRPGDQKPAREANPMPVEDSRLTKRDTLAEGPATEARPVEDAKSIVETVSDEVSLSVKQPPGNPQDPSKPTEPQLTETAPLPSPQKGLSIDDKSPMVPPQKNVEKKSAPEMPKVNKATGVQLKAAWQTHKEHEQPGFDLTATFGNGCLQYWALFIAMMAQFALITHNLLPNIIAPSVDHWCKQPQEFFNITAEEWRNISAPLDVNGVWDHCFRYNPPLSVASSNRTLVPCQEWDFDPSSGNSIIREWNLVCDRRWLLKFASVAYFSSALAATPIVGYFSDEVGRRPVICISVTVLLVSGTAICIVNTFAPFVVLRASVAASVNAVRITSFVLLYELCAPKYQIRYCMLALGGSLITGQPSLGALRLVGSNWILAQALLMLPTSLLACAFYVTAESPRWLVSKAKYEDVERALLWAAQMNRKGVKQTKRQWRTIWEALRQVDAAVSARGKSGLSGILSSPILFRRSVILFFCWFVAIVAYYARFKTYKADSIWLLLTSVILKVPSFLLAYWSFTRVGRRRTLCAVLVGFSVIFGFGVLFVELELFPVLVEVMHRVCDVLIDVIITLLFTYNLELFPTEVRSTGLYAAYFFGRLGSLAAPVLLDVARTVTLCAVSVGGVLAALTVLFLPETKSCAIVDTIMDMDEAKHQEKMVRLDHILKSSAQAIAIQPRKHPKRSFTKRCERSKRTFKTDIPQHSS
ncbi:hypothetical protein HPB47_018691 [Ixodes persulcatus]|uniref:Uncharacterized protein n=1 Tax=Ixodes persulcatus TaxID=34615 RepID=A0AC60QK22_IXOPE|nr:hypothetical protein HPB47_018691 [Ixodes persulcatus]